MGGYGPKSNKNEYGHSVCRFANNTSRKKITDSQKKTLDDIEENILKFMESRISIFNKIFPPLRRSISPWINKLYVHLDVFPEKESKDKKLADSGFITYNLCLNAQTAEKHTECDASYTIIAVPNQINKAIYERKKNDAKFELNLSDDSTMIIPMNIASLFTYSGFLVTHRQQIHNPSDEVVPFVNVVSYNSKRLFENMLQSFRRYLGEDKREKQLNIKKK